MERKFTKKRGATDRKPFKKDGDNNSFGGRGNSDGARRGPRPPRMSIPKGTEINYKNVAFLQKCLTERGKLFSRIAEPRHSRTGQGQRAADKIRQGIRPEARRDE